MNLIYRQIFEGGKINLSGKIIAAYPLSSGVDLKNGYNGIVGSDVSFSPTINGNGALFNGSANSYISLADNDIFSYTNGTTDKPFSIAGWLKITTEGYVISKAINAYDNSGEWAFQYYQNAVYFRLQDKTTSGVRIGFWVATSFSTTKHFTITYDGSLNSAGLKFYIDGVIVATSAFNSGTYSGCKNTTRPVFLGSASDGTNRFSGILAETYFFNSELTITEITALQSKYYPF